MTLKRIPCTGRRPVHLFKKLGGAVAGAMLAAAPFSAAQAAPAQIIQVSPAQSVDDFYRGRGGAPLWLASNSGDAAQQLMSLLTTASLDGLQGDRYNLAALQAALETARAHPNKPKLVEAADHLLSQAFVAYVRDMRSDPGLGISYVDPQLRPKPPTALAALLEATTAPSLSAYVRDFGWMHPIYGELRHALASHGYANDHERQLLEFNLERARALPAGRQRYVLVNAAEQKLYMWENRQAVDSMRVVVGKPKYPTPMMTAYIRFAALNPYWYVAPDLAAERIAPKVLKQGMKYLDELGYQVLDDWTENPRIIDPKTIDWKAVADGKVELKIRQLPGPHNSMGRIKFMFPNDAGVYLHDNPERELFEQAARLYSGGCVRLEDAWRLSKWLFGRDLTWEGAGTEEPVALTYPVPVYITYLTALPNGDEGSIAYFDDVYGRDAAKLANLQSNGGTTVANAAK